MPIFEKNRSPYMFLISVSIINVVAVSVEALVFIVIVAAVRKVVGSTPTTDLAVF